MMMPGTVFTQVRGANFPHEIPDGISSLALVRYRSGCQDDLECSGYTQLLKKWVSLH
jgi:hypothetical protein